MLGELFWASLLIIFGISMLLGTLFGITIPVFRIFIGFFLVYLGIQMIANWPARKEQVKESIYFGKRSLIVEAATIQGEKPVRYTVMFGTADIDLSHIEAINQEHRPVKLEIKTLFGNTQLKINKDIPTKIISSTSFGQTEFPNDTNITFGSYTYRTYEEGKPHLVIRTSTAFGKLEITS